jgi:ribA/ribD-fused uncharacterized protein
MNSDLEAGTVDFYRPDDPGYMLTCFSKHPLTVEQRLFPSAEHLYQFLKFELTAPRVASEIQEAPTPFQAKQIATRYQQYMRSDWQSLRDSVMKLVCAIKTLQHPEIRDYLYRHHGAILRENSPHDTNWGIGRNGTGRNQLGITWMELSRKMFSAMQHADRDVPPALQEEVSAAPSCIVLASQNLNVTRPEVADDAISLKTQLDC